MSGRVVRIFLSSTFRDFGEERDLLVRQLFPTLRARLQSRFVDLIDVDLRWGITAEEAERGDVLPICLSEIDRARRVLDIAAEAETEGRGSVSLDGEMIDMPVILRAQNVLHDAGLAD